MVGTICAMMNLNTYAENHGDSNLSIFVLIDLKREITEDTVFVMKAKTQILIVFRKQSVFEDGETGKHSLGLFRPNKSCIRLKTEMVQKN